MVLGTKERIVADRQFATERYILSTNPLLYLPLYRLDGSSFLSADGIGHKCDVTSALWTPQGRIFRSADRIDCGDNTLFDPRTSNFSIGEWFKTPTFDQTFRRIISKQGPVGYVPRYFLRLSTTDKWAFSVHDGTNEVSASSTGTLSSDTWYMLTLVRNGTTVSLYENTDATPVATNTNASLSDVNPTGRNLYISSLDGSSEFLKGSVGDVWFYNRALTPQEIQNLYLATRFRYQ